jgi:hypothetical protein
MAQNNTVLGQMLPLLPRHVLEHQVETHAWQGPKPRKLSSWSQLVAMLYAQLSGKKSLRDLVFSLGRHQRQLYHLGLSPARRSTLAEANDNAVLIQIWTAMIAYLLLLWIKIRRRVGWSILELTRLMHNLVMEPCNLRALLCPRTSDPPKPGQSTLLHLGGNC